MMKDYLGGGGVVQEATNRISEAAVTSVATKWGMGGGTATSIFGWLTSNGAAVFIGIVVTIAGFLVNYWFQRRREKREIADMDFQHKLALEEERRKEEMHQAQLAAIKESLRT